MPKAFRGLATALVLLALTSLALADDAIVPSPRGSGGDVHAIRVPAEFKASIPHVSASDYGSFAWLEVTGDQLAEIRRRGVAVRDIPNPYHLTLGGRTFDPAQESPDLPDGLVSLRSEGPELHVVQMRGPAKAAWLEALRADGVEIVQYVHPYTYVVWGTSAAVDAVRSRPAVRWAGAFAPAYRLLPAHRGLRGTQAVRVLIYRGGEVPAVLDELATMAARIDAPRTLSATYAVVTAEMPLDRLAEVAAIPGVYSVQPVPQDGGLRGEMSCQVNVNNLDLGGSPVVGYGDWLSLAGVTGAGITIANVDSGIQNDHPDLIGRFVGCTGVTCGGAAQSNHGTHTAGIMAADSASGTLDGLGFLRGLGVAPGAQLVEQVYDPHYTLSNGMLLLMTDSVRSGAIISGNSWGPSNNPHGYDNDTMQVDIGVRDADPDTPGNQPLTYVLSIMNGYGTQSSQGTPDEAKNIITVGSTEMQLISGAPSMAFDDISANSAHGPALDGRTIPHLVAPGWYVDSTVPSSTYSVDGGTSMASPQVSGAAALFIEYYRGLPTYTADPSPALIKAALLPVAHDLNGHLDADGNILGHPFDSKQGWGRLNLEAVVTPSVDTLYFDDPEVFDNTGEEWDLPIVAADPNEPVRIMLVWTDAPGHGLGGSTPAWNNDLDLIVERGESVYYGNAFGPDGWSATGGAPDGMNNTEGVFLPAPLTGTSLIRVVAAGINSDAIPGAGDTTDQDFALVCYNCAETVGFRVEAAPADATFCAGETPTFDIDVVGLGGFDEAVTLNATGVLGGASADFDVNPVIASGSSTLTLNNTAAWPSGDWPIAIQGEHTPSGTVETANVAVHVYAGTPAAVTLLAPANHADDVTMNPGFQWTPVNQATGYLLDVARDDQFTDIVYSTTVSGTAHIPMSPLTANTDYFWRVRPENPCGIAGVYSTFQFRTEAGPRVLVVDDDDGSPDVRADYTDTLTALGFTHDVWDTNAGDDEPDLAVLASYKMVIWFTGDAFGGSTGPGLSAEAALGEYLDAGGCVFISSQDYVFDRGRTPFMSGYLGVDGASEFATGDVTGMGDLFGGLGPYDLDVPYPNYSDRLTPDASAVTCLMGDGGPAGISKDTGAYRTMFWGFGLESLPTPAVKQELLGRVVNWCRAGNPPGPGDFDNDGDVDLDDFAAWDGCVTGPETPASGECAVFDLDADTDVDLHDFHALARLYVP